MRKLAFVAFGILAAAGGCSTEAEDEPALPPLPTDGVTMQQLEAFDALETTTHQRWTWLQHEELKTPLHLSAKRTGARVLQRGENPHVRTLAVLNENRALFKMRDPGLELAAEKTESDALGMAHARFQQTVHGVPVRGAEVMAHYDREGRLASIDANYVAGLDDVDVNPRFEAKDALAVVKADVLSRSVVDESSLEADAGELVVYAEPTKDGSKAKGRLAYEFHVRALAAEHPAIWVVNVDAHTGDILDRRNDLQTIQASGKGVLNDDKQFEVSNGAGGFQMVDTSTGVSIQTFTAQQQEVAPGNIVTSNSTTTWDRTQNGAGAAVDAHFNAAAVAKYYRTVHNRNAIDGNGGALQSTVHFGRQFDNAAWIKTGMIYGDGGQLFRALSVSLDVVGHEFTHGVIEKTSNLIYKNQSGALNEAVSDIFGAFIEHTVAPDAQKNWLLGEQVVKSGKPLRDMVDPRGGLEPQPRHMNEFVQTTQDEGGVHINSGIINNAAYLMTVGGTNKVSNVTIKTGIGWEKSEKLWYRANSQYFMQSTGFEQAAAGVMSAAKDIGLTQNEQNIVDCAFKATGIVQGACATIASTDTPGTTSGGTGDVDPEGSSTTNTPSSTDDDDDDDTTTTKKKPKKKRAVTTETSGCNTTGTGPNAGSLLAVLGLAALLGTRKRRR
ncbi:MAG: peptidase M4 family protein [Labilithrix sp.]|nr:peptidase M4 family protein [Labilithrix sp.]MCW5809533.1 peptidase M4 family protein [Labilithrix sp.]